MSIISTIKNYKILICVVLAIVMGVFIGNLQPFEGLNEDSMKFAGIFLAVIFLLVTQALPDWVIILAASSLFVVTGVTSIDEVYVAFSSSTIWLIIMVFALATAKGNSGLLPRFALKILTFFPANYKGAVLALMTSGIAVGPLIPSVNAKVNIMIPIATAVTKQMGFKERSKGALGLFSACYLTIFLGGNAFLTGSTYVAIMLGFLTEKFTLVSWFVATCVWFIIIIIGTYIWCITYCKPEEKVEFPPTFFKDRLKELGPVTKKEKFAGLVLLIALAGWSTVSIHGIDTSTLGLLAVCALAGYGLLSTNDFITKIPWNLIIFIGGLLGIATLMNTTGWSDYIANLLGPVFEPIVGNPWIFVPFLCIFTYLLRFIIIEQITSLIITLAIFSPFMEQAGMSLFVLVFVQLMASIVWNVPYQNPFTLATLQIAGGKYVTFEEFRKDSYFYMVICIIACTLSIPLWQLLGYIW